MQQSFLIGHLYPKYLNLYGDYGNIACLTKRLEWRGIESRVEDISINQSEKKLQNYNLLFIGGGQDRQQELIAQDFLNKKQELQELSEQGLPVLAVCGGYQLLGESYETVQGEILPGLKLLDIQTRSKQEQETSPDRLVGNVVAEINSQAFAGKLSGKLVGFENHAGRTLIKKQSKTQALAHIKKGFGNNAEDKSEGAVYKNIIGTYLHGSLLPKNPALADYLIWQALIYSKHSYTDKHNELEKLNDKIELQAHKKALELK